MKIINAEWEKRNLNVDCYEIDVERCDDPETIEQELKGLKCDYYVAKIPVGCLDINRFFENNGFTFVETIIPGYFLTNIPVLDRITERLFKEMSYKKATDDDLQVIFSELKKGVFKTDRVALDPSFGVAKGADRYVGWTKDIISRGGEAYIILYKSNKIGFLVMMEKNEKELTSYLGGLFDDYLTSGLGFAIPLSMMRIGADKNKKKVYGCFSTNNQASMAVHMKYGFIVDEAKYVFVKHRKTQN